ncbi:hypothetical protein HHI36_011185 [Cryptolaemus montrouzieri]|uniref:Uncharacterized protein n=1 Tax=Cryptolaemus montrouzieri TaxID=559131 RepID=A0ABD2ML13_9CUCU
MKKAFSWIPNSYNNLEDLHTYVITTVEPNIYLVIVFESKKSEKDVFIETFISEMCTNLRCTKVFTSLKYTFK